MGRRVPVKINIREHNGFMVKYYLEGLFKHLKYDVKDIDLDSICISFYPPYRPEVDSTEKLINRMLKGVIREMEVNKDYNVSKDKLCKIMGISRTTLYDLIKKRTLIFSSEYTPKVGVPLSDIYKQLTKN